MNTCARKSTAKTIAKGAEPFDKSYGLGYKVGHGDLSPYARVNRLRAAFFALPFAVDTQRAQIVTEVYQNHPERSNRMNAAYALKEVLEQATLYLYDDELIIGGIAAPAKAAPVYPAFSVDWIIHELKHFPFRVRSCAAGQRRTAGIPAVLAGEDCG